MARCKYCKKYAGIFRSKHAKCERKHNEECQNLTNLLFQAFKNHSDFYLLGNEINTLISSGGISNETVQMIYLNAFDNAVEEYLNDGIISEDESKTVARFQQYTALPQQTLDSHKSLERVIQAKILQQLFNNLPLTSSVSINNGALPFLFQKDETPIWVYHNVKYYEQKIRSEYRAQNNMFTYRIWDGFYYTRSNFKGAPIETIHNVYIGNGVVVLTEKHLYFSCARRSFKIPFHSLIHIQPFSDGLRLQEDNEYAQPFFLKGMDSWFAYNFIVNIARR